MSEQVVYPQVQQGVVRSLPIKLWTPRVIGCAAFFLGVPAGLLLLALNRSRMGLGREARNLMLIGAAGLLVYSNVAILAPGDALQYTAMLVGTALAFCFYKLAGTDRIEFERVHGEVSDANWLVGFFMGLTATVTCIAALFCIVIVAYTLTSLLGIQLPE